MKALLRYFFLVFGCLHLVGGPYSLLQTYAWLNMIIDYSQETGVSQAVADTFSGEKPCCLCKQIAEAKSAESEREPRQPLSPSSGKPVDPLFAPAVIALRNPHHENYLHPGFPSVTVPSPWLSCGPPIPPPKC